MTTFGLPETPSIRLGPLVRYLVGIGGLAFSITILWLALAVLLYQSLAAG